MTCCENKLVERHQKSAKSKPLPLANSAYEWWPFNFSLFKTLPLAFQLLKSNHRHLWLLKAKNTWQPISKRFVWLTVNEYRRMFESSKAFNQKKQNLSGPKCHISAIDLAFTCYDFSPSECLFIFSCLQRKRNWCAETPRKNFTWT